MRYARFFIILLIIFNAFCRSPHRPKNINIPYITIKNSKSQKIYTFKDSHLRQIPMFKTFDSKFFHENLIPESVKLKNKNISGQELNKKINTLLEDILKRKTIKDFIVLKNRDFNPVTRSGLIVLKFKDYPLVVKLFLENAKSLSKPYHNGFQVRGLFIVGGCLRHLAGFTRVKNAQEIRKKCSESDYWRDKIVVPRKWFWLPKNAEWLEIKGYNMANKQIQEVRMPKIYGILADAIEHDPKIVPSNKECLKLATYLEYIVDPNTANFVIEKETGKIGAIDTEHFPTMFGYTKKIKPAPDYISWYTRLTKEYVKNFFMFKNQREKIQFNTETEYPLV